MISKMWIIFARRMRSDDFRWW